MGPVPSQPPWGIGTCPRDGPGPGGEGGTSPGEAPSKPAPWSGPCTSSMAWVTNPAHPRRASEPTTAPEAQGPSGDSIPCALEDTTTDLSHLCLELVQSELDRPSQGRSKA